MVIVYRAKDLIEANIVAGLLRAHDIDCHVGGHYLQGGMGEIGTSGFTNVHVEDDDYDRARDLVEEYEQDQHRSATTPDPAPSGRSQVNRMAQAFLVMCAVLIGVLWVLSSTQ